MFYVFDNTKAYDQLLLIVKYQHNPPKSQI